MDEMQETPDSDDIIIELLTELVQQGRERRAGSVMEPPAEAPPAAEPQDSEMAELEQMLSAPPEETEAPSEETPGAEMAEGECPNCGKSPCEC